MSLKYYNVFIPYFVDKSYLYKTVLETFDMAKLLYLYSRLLDDIMGTVLYVRLSRQNFNLKPVPVLTNRIRPKSVLFSCICLTIWLFQHLASLERFQFQFCLYFRHCWLLIVCCCYCWFFGGFFPNTFSSATQDIELQLWQQCELILATQEELCKSCTTFRCR